MHAEKTTHTTFPMILSVKGFLIQIILFLFTLDMDNQRFKIRKT